jgi:type II secretory pathway component GspD/PulD (secretin)
MKKTFITALLGALALQLAWSQTNAPGTNETVTAEPAATNQTIVTAGTNELLVTTSSNEVTGATTVTSVTATNDAAGVTNPPVASIPLIQFQDVPITTAIENLARQANINYLLDPKIGYGQPDASGQIKAEPTLSIRWENITAYQALLALLDNYGLQLIQDRSTQIGRITIKDPTAPPPLVTRVVQLKYSSVSNMTEAVQSVFTDKRSRVLPDNRTSQLVIVATDPEQGAVDTLINQLDKPTRQVLIETKLVEVSSNPSTAKGIDWSGTLAAQNFSFGNGVLQSGASSTTAQIPGVATSAAFGNNQNTTAAGSSQSTTLTIQPQGSTSAGGLSINTASGLTPGIGFLNADGVHAVLSFLNQSSEAQVVSTPRVVTLDNETATIGVTRAFPVINVTASTAGVSSGSSSITYSNIGTVLEVTPRISANDYIWLKVTPDVSSFFGTVSKTIAGQVYQADEFDSRHIETQVLIPNAHTLVMGGLVKDNPNATYTKVPLLGDIPGLGWAFRSESKSLDKDNLLIFITPTILKDNDYTPTTTEFLQSKPVTMKPPMNARNKWDSSVPSTDWSNPDPTDSDYMKSKSSSLTSTSANP